MNKSNLFARPKQTAHELQSTATAFAKIRRAVYLQKLSSQVFIAWFSAVLIYTVITIIFNQKPFVPMDSNLCRIIFCALTVLKTGLFF